MIRSRTAAKIRRLHKEGKTIEEIQKSFPKLVIQRQEIIDLLKSYKMLEWSIRDGIKHLKCNKCGNIKPYTYEYFQITEKFQSKECRDCRNLVRRNKRRLKNNLGIKDIKNIHDTRRWWREKIIRIIDMSYYKTRFKPKYIEKNKPRGFYQGFYKKSLEFQQLHI